MKKQQTEDTNTVLDISFDVRFRIAFAIDRESLSKEFDGDALKYITSLVAEEGTIEGITEKEFKILTATARASNERQQTQADIKLTVISHAEAALHHAKEADSFASLIDDDQEERRNARGSLSTAKVALNNALASTRFMLGTKLELSETTKTAVVDLS